MSQHEIYSSCRTWTHTGSSSSFCCCWIYRGNTSWHETRFDVLQKSNLCRSGLNHIASHAGHLIPLTTTPVSPVLPFLTCCCLQMGLFWSWFTISLSEVAENVLLHTLYSSQKTSQRTCEVEIIIIIIYCINFLLVNTESCSHRPKHHTGFM